MAKSKPEFRHRISIGALLRELNPWSAWMSDDEQPPLSGMRYTALLLRELSIRRLVDRLAPALLAADAAGQAIVERVLRENPLTKGEPSASRPGLTSGISRRATRTSRRSATRRRRSATPTISGSSVRS